MRVSHMIASASKPTSGGPCKPRPGKSDRWGRYVPTAGIIRMGLHWFAEKTWVTARPRHPKAGHTP
jgi:hypothetical protein